MVRPASLLVALLALAVAGCGTADDREQVEAAAERFYVALQKGDGAAACRELSEPAVEALEDQEGAACARAVTELDLVGRAIISVEVAVTNAKVDLLPRQTAFLSRGPSGWKLSAVGCRPGGKPADHPYDCELEA